MKSLKFEIVLPGMVRSWVEISRSTLRANIAALRRVVGPEPILCAVVKANAYGHGIREVAAVLQSYRAWSGVRQPSDTENLGREKLRHPADAHSGVVHSEGDAAGVPRGWLGVDSCAEAAEVRGVGVHASMLILGYVPIGDARTTVRTGVRVTVAMPETVRALAAAARSLRRIVPVHVKVETGAQRQGVVLREIPAFVRLIERSRGLVLEGVSTHLADVEDTGSDGFAAIQLARFDRAVTIAEHIAGRRLLRHASASAGAMVLPNGRFDLVRMGIALYGLWPSERVHAIVERRSRRLLSPLSSPFPRGGEGEKLKLRPVLTWKTIVGPMHDVPRGASVGYGCTERVRRRTRLAVLPVGYWDGYDRKLSSTGEVLIRGHRCKVLGRVCMNMIMVDVTDVPRVRLEDEVVLIGRQARQSFSGKNLGGQGRRAITADELAGKIGTINYEVVTRINPMLPRRAI